jgi:serine/threonine protein kinase
MAEDRRRERPGTELVESAESRISMPPNSREGGPESGAAGTHFVPGTVVNGKFTLQRVVAFGAMGTVFEARDMFVERQVALKLMHPHLMMDANLVTRFRREAQAAARIQHPNVVIVFEVGKHRDKTFYIAQEFLVGKTLRKLLDTRKTLDIAEAISIAIPVIGGVAAAHACDIVHRDLKPENIVFARTSTGEFIPKIIDFGIAKVNQDIGTNVLSHFGSIMGTLQYMSPEQIDGKPVDGRADVWAMGVMLYEMLTGERPFEGDSAGAILNSILTKPPVALETKVPQAAAFSAAIHRAIQKDPTDRHPSMQAFQDELVNLRDSTRLPNITLRDKPRTTVKLPSPIDTPIISKPELDPKRLIAEDQKKDETRKTRASLVPNEGEGPVSFSPMLQPEMEWRDEPMAASVREVDWVEQAEHALSVNALRYAADSAERAFSAPDITHDVQARMWLVQAIAKYWLGEFAAAYDAAEKAKKRLARGSTGWHAAFGHLVIAAGHLGRKPVLFAAAKELEALAKSAGGVTNQANLVSGCRLAIFAMRTGLVEVAHNFVREALQSVGNNGETAPFVRAWIDVASAEIALHTGDLTAYVQHIHSAVELFTSAGDLRNACLQRANLGNGFLQLGAHELAAGALEEAIGIAEPMQLAFISGTARANLGIALASLGRVDEGIQSLTVGLEHARLQGNVRAEAYAITYLARMLARQNQYDVALASARQAAHLAENVPGLRGFALAVQADVLLAQGQPAVALELATAAMTILQELEGVEEGESLIRVVHALALRGLGHAQEGKRWISVARRGLRTKAARISDERWRQCFLENDPDNARLLRVAAHWSSAH